MKSITLLIALTISTLTTSALAASFNCSKAKTWTETTLCSNPELSQLDELLAASYQRAISSNSNKTKLKEQQKQWLSTIRDACGDIACLKTAYTTRISELNEKVANPTINKKAIVGHYERYVKNKPDYHSASIDVKLLSNGEYNIDGSAVWIGNAETGNINTGEISGYFALKNNTINYHDDNTCPVTLMFSKNTLTIEDNNIDGCWGHNVTFGGTYRKTK